MKVGKYFYGIIPQPDSISLELEGIIPGFGGIHTVDYEGLAALVSNAPVKVYNPEKEIVLKHEKIVASVMQDTTIIPARFGMVAQKPEEIRRILQANYQPLRDKLTELENKVELSLRVFWQKNKMAADIENEELNKLKAEIETQKVLDQALQLKLGEIAYQVVEDRRADYIRQIFEPLKEKAVKAKINNVQNVRMILNCAFLIKREDEPGFDASVNELYLRYAETLDFKYSGPWPPYNFVDLVITFVS